MPRSEVLRSSQHPGILLITHSPELTPEAECELRVATVFAFASNAVIVRCVPKSHGLATPWLEALP